MKLYSPFDRKISHHRRYSLGQMAHVLTAAGFEIVDIRYVNVVGALAWWPIARML